MTLGKRLRIGVVGLGKIAQMMHLHYLAELPEFQITAVCDLSKSLREYISERYAVPVKHCYQEFEELVQAPIDAVFVLNTHHAPVVLAALAAGKHVFVEKPLCWNLSEADAIIAASKKYGGRVMVGYMKRYDPGFELAAEEFQRLDTVHFIRLHNFAGGRHRYERIYPVYKPSDVGCEVAERAKEDIDTSMAEAVGSRDPWRLGVYRSLMELCSHDINIQRAVFGQPLIEDAFTYSIDQQTVYSARMRHSSGARCMWEIMPSFDTGRNWDEELAAYTPEAVVLVRWANPFIRNAATLVSSRRLDGLRMIHQKAIASHENLFALELHHFAQSIETDAEPVTNPEDARQDLQLLIQLTKIVNQGD